jgi:MFS family permease
VTPPAKTSRVVWPAYAAEGLTSLGTSVLMLGIFFYTEHHFGWGLRENFLLAAAQGFVYVFAALLTNRICAAIGRRRTLVIVYAASALVALLALAARTPLLVAATLCAYTFVNTISWPAVESLVSSGVDAHTLSRRIGIYNLIWSGMNGVGLAASGALIEYWPAGMFIVPAVVHGLSSLLLVVRTDVEPPGGVDQPSGHVAPEPELLRARTLALWLSRIALPATYVVIYSLMAMMPSLPVMQSLEPTWRTPLASVWILARFIMFIMLGATTWWHTRPMLLLASAAVMLVAFVGVASGASFASMVAWQIVLGAVMGMIYSASLYFGMVLSDGSTEHGGYHEALIGFGGLLGPGAGALAQWLRPGDLRFGVIAVSAVVGASVVAAMIAAYRAKKRVVDPPDPLPRGTSRV